MEKFRTFEPTSRECIDRGISLLNLYFWNTTWSERLLRNTDELEEKTVLELFFCTQERGLRSLNVREENAWRFGFDIRPGHFPTAEKAWERLAEGWIAELSHFYGPVA